MEPILAARWISTHRRTVRDDERLPDHHQTIVTWVMITIMTRVLVAFVLHTSTIRSGKLTAPVAPAAPMIPQLRW